MAKGSPKGLAKGGGGRALWNGVVKGFELRADELRILEDACYEADLIDDLQRLLVDEDAQFLAAGSTGQVVVAPVVQEIRMHRKVLADLLAKLKLGDAGEAAGKKTGRGPKEASEGDRSSSGRRLATQRWGTRG